MTNCPNIENQILDFAEQKLDKNAMQEFQSHIDTCANCRLLVDKFKFEFDVIEQEKSLKPDDSVLESIMDKTINKPYSVKSSQKTVITILRPVMVAASIGIGIVLGLHSFKLLNLNQNINLTEKDEAYYFHDLGQETVEFSLMEE